MLEFLVLSFQQGTQHPYYVSAMAPPIAALTGIGAVAFYQAYRRSGRWSLLLPLAIAVTGALGLRPAAPYPRLEPVAALDDRLRQRRRRCSP